MLAGGAWTSLFCASLGIRLPQLKVLSSVMRTAPVAEAPDTCTYMDEVGYRKRRDGGYTIARGAGFVVPVRPGFVALPAGVPADPAQGTRLHEAAGERAVVARVARRRAVGALDRPSPFERDAGVGPGAEPGLNRQALAAMIRLYPHFRDVPIVQEWARIHRCHAGRRTLHRSRRRTLPGLTVATGFSGHGFGIGPGCRAPGGRPRDRATPSVDPTPFRALPIQRRLADRHRPGYLVRVGDGDSRLSFGLRNLSTKLSASPTATYIGLGPSLPERESAAVSRRRPPSPWCRGDSRLISEEPTSTKPAFFIERDRIILAHVAVLGLRVLRLVVAAAMILDAEDAAGLQRLEYRRQRLIRIALIHPVVQVAKG